MWRELYPAGIHYLIGQILGSAVLLWLAGHVGNAQERYYSYTLVITGLTGVLVMFPAVYFYRKDRIGRLIGGLTSVEEQRLSIPEMLLLLAAGAGFAQYANVLVA
ncbi:MAG: CPBP family intramembrane metalloprotease, partial [Blautia sp.]|nr:CPBP family intramembrane metalloprotease [Blautia sp.]